MQASIKLFKMNPDNRVYKVGVVSKLGEKAFSAHDATGVPRFMRLRKGEYAVDLRHENIPTNEGKVLAVEGMIRPYPVSIVAGSILLDNRLRIKWIPAKEISYTTELDGSFMDARGFRYFASTRAATEWLISYLVPILKKSDAYLAEKNAMYKAAKEEEGNKMAKLYAAANGDNYGEEYNVPVITQGPNTWWASLNEAEKHRIFQQHEGNK